MLVSLLNRLKDFIKLAGSSHVFHCTVVLASHWLVRSPDQSLASYWLVQSPDQTLASHWLQASFTKFRLETYFYT